MHSLANHPEVTCAGEFYCNEQNRCDLQHWKNKQSGNWNLTKTFFLQEPPKPSITIFLYRSNTEAQLESYLKACSTGQWMPGMVSPPVTPLPNFLEQVQQTKDKIAPVCDLCFAYEELLSNWDQVLSKVLDIMQWVQQPLPKALHKQNVNT